MTIYVVLETTGGWSGTDTYSCISQAFYTRGEAFIYCARKMSSGHASGQSADLWRGEVFEVQLSGTK